MISIQYGKITAVKPPRASVELYGFGDDAVLENALVLSPAGQSENSSVHFPISGGDVVAVLFDADYPQNSLILGGVYGNGDTLPGEGDEFTLRASAAVIHANSVKIGANLSAIATSPASRSDLVAQNLAAIQASVTAIVTAFNVHTHTIQALPVSQNASIIGYGFGPTLVPNVPMAVVYNPTSTDANSVVID